MKIIRDEDLATLTLVPVEPEEEQVIAVISAMLKPEDRLCYDGRSEDGDGDKFCKIHLHAGGHREERREISGKATLVRQVYVDSIELILRGSTEDDKHEVGRIRDICFFGSSGLIFLEETEVDGKKAIVTTGKRCKLCGVGMIKRAACEWSTCDECAAKCEHNYIRGAFHGGGVDIGVGDFCSICGRGKPKEEGVRRKTQIEQHLAVEKELGMLVLYDHDGIPLTPRQLVQLNRLARRYEKACQRKLANAIH